MKIDITLQNQTTHKAIPSLDKLQSWVKTALEHTPHKLEHSHITIRFVDKQESATLNETYRKKTGPTNVLSFPDEPIPGFESESLGDLALCTDLVIEEAHAQEKALTAHWAHLIVHGTLHLLGYDHLVDEDALVMENLEIDILNTLGFENPYSDESL